MPSVVAEVMLSCPRLTGGPHTVTALACLLLSPPLLLQLQVAADSMWFAGDFRFYSALLR